MLEFGAVSDMSLHNVPYKHPKLLLGMAQGPGSEGLALRQSYGILWHALRLVFGNGMSIHVSVHVCSLPYMFSLRGWDPVTGRCVVSENWCIDVKFNRVFKKIIEPKKSRKLSSPFSRFFRRGMYPLVSESLHHLSGWNCYRLQKRTQESWLKAPAARQLNPVFYCSGVTTVAIL